MAGDFVIKCGDERGFPVEMEKGVGSFALMIDICKSGKGVLAGFVVDVDAGGNGLGAFDTDTAPL